jgi:hypothetical protein
MKKEGYKLYASSSLSYTFVSKGKRGEILKGVFFEEVFENIYNLALVDYDPETKQWSDEVASDNGDIVKIMATVVVVISEFLNEQPERIVYFKGNTPIKQKLYNRIMNNYSKELLHEFIVWGGNEDEREELIVGKEYQSFYIYKR